MLPIACALLLLVAPQVAFTSLDQARFAATDGEPLAGRVSPALGREAAEQIRPEVSSPEEIATWTRIARAGGAEAALAQALAQAIWRDGPGAAAAAEALVALPAAARSSLPSDRAWHDALGRLLLAEDREREVALAAIALSAPTLDARVALEHLRRLVEESDRLERAEHLLRELGRTSAHPRATYLAVAQLEDLPRALDGAAWACLSALVGRDEAAAAESIGLATVGAFGPGGAVIRSLGALPPERWEAVDGLLIDLLETAFDGVLAAAIASAADLRLPALGPMLPLLAERPGEEDDVLGARERAEATRAIGIAYGRDGETVDLLIALLEDREGPVRAAAYEALQRVTRAKLPARVGSWQTWRARANLPDTAPISSFERLELLRDAERTRRARLAERERVRD